MNEKNEKEVIERATADAFIELYNRKMGTSFSIIDHSDAPDIRCVAPEGNTLNLEITLTEDRNKDIAALLGRSDHRSFENLRKEMKEGKPNLRVSCFQENVIDQLIDRILPKLEKDYGPNVALVIRDTSPLDWPWDSELVNIRCRLKSQMKRNPFDKGIWIISYEKDKIYQIV